ncbi:hypothetical protein LBMAG52_42410 [Planctomycetia bacterium]|nr:hypothetical protein LBMAG52_42410 [Planctomycetia bacterium]
MTVKQHPNDDNPLSIEQARDKIAKAMNDLMAGNDPGTISFRLKPTKKPGELYQLKLTQQQRESLIQCTQIKNKLLVKIKEAGEGTQIIGLTRKELDQLHDEIGYASTYARSPHKRRITAVQTKVVELLSEDHAGLFGEEKLKARKPVIKTSEQLFQFKITLLDIRPAIWRRIQIPDCTLADLHEYIQAALGWQNCHLHLFEIDGERYSQPSPDCDDYELDFKDESGILISKLLTKSGERTKWIYEYDFGDGWRHEILFEGCPTKDPKLKHPLCLEGKRACPPEDCGGPGSYANLLEVIGNPKHEEHGEMLGWIGPFDPEAFDAKKVTREMRKVK